jgi:diguanylate cyclase (GGDEF)-like protein
MKSIVDIVEYLGNGSRGSIIALGLGIVLLVGVVDFLIGHGISLSIFYLLPISLVAWFAGRWAGLFLACVSAIIWFIADVVTENSYSRTYVPLWNAIVRLGFFVIVVYLLNAFKREKLFAREDYLTRLGNRRYFFEFAEKEIMRSKRYGHPFTLAYIDIDSFKFINDHFGHAEGDALLKATARSINANIRATDIAARMGGDEFAVLLPESGVDAANKLFDKLHRRLTEFAQKNKWPVSYSIGVAIFIKTPTSVDEMIRIVDRIMYSAKESGKNLVKYEVQKA